MEESNKSEQADAEVCDKFLNALNSKDLDGFAKHCKLYGNCDHEWCMKYKCYDYIPKHAKNARYWEKVKARKDKK